MAKMKVKVTKDDNYRILAASGVWGGLTPYGMVYFDIFLERPETPKRTLINIDEHTGRKEETIEDPSEPSIERLFLAGITVRPEIARSIGQWLIEKADEAEMIGRQPSAPTIVQ